MKWLDIIFDDILGPLPALPVEESGSGDVVNGESSGIRIDAMKAAYLVQETSQGQRPARMVGQSRLVQSSSSQTWTSDDAIGLSLSTSSLNFK